MKKKNLTSLMRTADDAPPTRSADAFWDEFRNAANQVEQEAGPRINWDWRWIPAPVLATGILLATLTWWPRPEEARVLSLDVVAEHESVMMMIDAERGGTIVWVDME